MAITVKKAAVEVEKYEKGLNNIARALLKEEGDDLVKYIQRTKFKKGGRPSPSYVVSRSGLMERSLRATTRFAGGGLVLEISVERPYVEEGSRPHIIRPKRRRFLKFEVDGKTVFAKQVRHPGIKPRRVLERSFEERATKIVERLEKNMVKEWERRLS